MNFKIPNKIRKLSKLEKKSLITRGLKLTEEVGELAAEILKFYDEKGSKGKTKEQVLDDLHLEAVDCTLMALDILIKSGASDKKISKIMNKQLDKWQDWLKEKYHK